MTKSKANLLLLLVTTIWGGGFIATEGALDFLSPFNVLTVRFLGASCILFPMSYKSLKKSDKDTLLKGIFVGIVLFFAFAFQTFGLVYSSPSVNAFLTTTYVLFVPYMMWLIFKKKPGKKELLASALCCVGIALLTLKPGSIILGIGDILSLICAAFFALQILLLERYGYVDALCMTTLQTLTAGILSLVCVLLFDKIPISIPSSAMFSIFYLIVISTCLAYFCQTYAQKYTTANSASLIMAMEALFASLFSYLIFDEVMSTLMIMGACLIFISILVVEYRPKQKK